MYKGPPSIEHLQRERGSRKCVTISVVIPTYRREQVLCQTVEHICQLLSPGDEVVIIDQTPHHEPATDQALRRLTAEGKVRWYRRHKPNISEAMNAGALLARGELLVFLDDDVVPCVSLLEVYRNALSGPESYPAVCGQVLQPWNNGPVHKVKDFGENFNAAYSRPCEILSLMAGNFAIQREIFFAIGGFDENFFGACYRFESEFSHRIHRRTSRKVRFIPEARIHHLHTSGGTRSFGHKDTWAGIGGVAGDYYFAMRCLTAARAFWYCVRRVFRAPVNRNTLRRPWLIPSLFVRELVAWALVMPLLIAKRPNYIKELSAYNLREAVLPQNIGKGKVTEAP